MKKLLIFLFLSASLTTTAQSYRTSFGFKLDWSNLDVAMGDFSMKHFFNGTPSALEVNFGIGRRRGWLQAMYHRNQPLFKGAEWYWGLGGDVGYWNNNYDYFHNGRQYEGFWTGADGTIGVEYTFNSLPINVSLDVGPTVRVIPYVAVGFMSGFAVRFALR